MSVNWLYPPFDNPAIRRALMGAIDQTEFVTAVAGTDPSAWQVPTGIFSSGHADGERRGAFRCDQPS